MQVMDNVPSSNGYQGGFGTALMTKDLGLAQDAATRAQAATPLGSLAHQVNWEVEGKGHVRVLGFSSRVTLKLW